VRAVMTVCHWMDAQYLLRGRSKVGGLRLLFRAVRPTLAVDDMVNLGRPGATPEVDEPYDGANRTSAVKSRSSFLGHAIVPYGCWMKATSSCFESATAPTSPVLSTTKLTSMTSKKSLNGSSG
jgi:hypothetical protein